MQNKIFVSTLLLVLATNVNCGKKIVRQTANGPVEGLELKSALHKKYHAFKGVPFAEPPISGTDPYTGEEVDRRFKATQPLKRRWSENLEANDFKSTCVPSTHTFVDLSRASEDCLYLNIYVPAGGAEKKTVMVWIHGGGFTTGDATDFMYGPDFLLSEDNILVTIQYRVGIFGFLNLGSGEYTGNMGLKDQQMAIKWVYENIEYFYGNKDEILLFGESAGGISVNFHMLNEESRKYFNRAYVGSGTAFNYWALDKANHMKRVQDYSKIDDENQLIDYLRTSDTEVLLNCYPWEVTKNFNRTLISPWEPTIENPDTVGAFIIKTPDELYNSENPPVMDALFIFNSHEYAAFIPGLEQKSEPILVDSEEKLRLPFDDFNERSHPEEYEQALKKLETTFYSNPSDIEAVQRSNVDLLSELNFGYGILKTVLLQARANTPANKNTFLARFSADSDLNTIKMITKATYNGAAHGEDLCYFFHCGAIDSFGRYKKHLKQKDAVYNTIMRMVKMITNFARSGNPSIDDDTPFKSVESASEVFCQEISNDPKSSVTTNIMEQLHYNIWREIEETYRQLTQSN